MAKYTEDDLKKELETQEYEYGFYTDIESETFPKGLNADIVRAISKKKNEPQWMLDWRLDALKIWLEMEEEIPHLKERMKEFKNMLMKEMLNMNKQTVLFLKEEIQLKLILNYFMKMEQYIC